MRENSEEGLPGRAPRKDSKETRRAADIVVLHVDDVPNDAALVRAAAERAGLELKLHNVGDADAAVAYLSAALETKSAASPQPSLVLLDMKLPRTDGIEFLNWLRSRPQHQSLPVIVLSGSELQADVQSAYLAGANSYFVKPPGFDSLVDIVKNIGRSWLDGTGS